MTTSRREILQATLGLCITPLVACTGHHAALEHCNGKPADFETIPTCGFTVLRIGPAEGRTVLLLHELPGLTPEDLALARCLSDKGFNVYAPLLFGKPWQSSLVRGYRAACKPSMFDCSNLEARSAILDKLEPLAECLARKGNGPIGVIGMCLTGILPLALLPNEVEAAVLCQPTLPFSFWHGAPTGKQIEDLGLGSQDLDEAMKSPTSFLAVHYAQDKRSPVGRMRALQSKFRDRVAVISLPGEHHHSSLAGDFDPTAFVDTVTYLNVRLDVEKGPKRMALARLEGQECEITADGTWRKV